MGIKIYFTKNQFLKYYMNVGSSYINLSRNSSYYLLGIYNNMGLINMNLFIFKLKKSFNFLFNVFLKNCLLNIILVNTQDNKFLNRIYLKVYKKLNISYFIGSWWNGFLKNFKLYTRYGNKRKKNYYVFKNLLPFSAMYMGQSKYFKKDLSSYNFYNESNNISVFSIMFVNSTVDTHKAPGVLFQNTRNLINNFFLNNLSVKLIKKILFSLKKKFCYFIYNNFKVFNLKKTILNVFFEDYYLNVHKKNFFKSIKWGGDLK